MEINIAILDDEQIYRDEIVKCIEESHIDAEYKVDTFADSKELLGSEKEYNIVFVDVELSEEKDGFAVTKEYREKKGEALIIIVTTHEEMSTEGYIVKAFRYIFKRNMQNKIEEALNSAIIELKRNQPIKFKLVGGDYISVQVGKIMYLENEKGKVNVRVYLENGDYLIKGRVETLKEILEEKGFVMPHRSYLVNSFWVEKVGIKDVILKNKVKIPVSRGNKQEIKNKIAMYKSM